MRNAILGNDLNYVLFTVLSISFEADAPTAKVGGSLLFDRRRRELPRGTGGYAIKTSSFDVKQGG